MADAYVEGQIALFFTLFCFLAIGHIYGCVQDHKTEKRNKEKTVMEEVTCGSIVHDVDDKDTDK